MNPWNFRSFLPGRLFLVSLAFAVGITALAYFAVVKKPSQKEAGLEASLSSFAQEKDSDGDGLKDWEEILWKTDSSNPDTDGDGTNDGEEVAIGRNPFIKGPDDVLPKNLTEGGNSSSTEVLTGTDRLTRALFTEYLLAKSQGKSLDQTTTKQIVSSVISKSNLLSGKRTYTEGEIKIGTDNGSEALRKYATFMGASVKRNGNWSGNELEIFTEGLEKENEKKLESLDPIISGYKKITDEMLQIEVPPVLVPSHLDTINGMMGILFCLKNFRNAFNDPITALASLDDYKKEAELFYQGASSAVDILEKKSVNFSSDEEATFYLLIPQALKKGS
ncbi:MAG: hypothetical protein AAB545_03010 [Patescibacteria group bacterium]